MIKAIESATSHNGFIINYTESYQDKESSISYSKPIDSPTWHVQNDPKSFNTIDYLKIIAHFMRFKTD